MNPHEKKLKETYQAILVFKAVGIGLIIIAVGLLLYDFSEFKALVYLLFPLGGFLIWMTIRMKKDVDENGVAKDKSLIQEIPSSVKPDEGLSQDNDEEEAIDLGLPKGIRIYFYDDYIQITRKWPLWRGLSNIVLSLFAPIIFWFVMSGENSIRLESEVPSWALAIAVGLIGVSLLGVFYSGLVKVVNKINIFASKEKFEIKHEPLPWFGNKKLDVSNIKQLYSKELITHSTSSSSGSSRVRVSYELHVITEDEQDVILLSDLENSNQALYLEQKIEKYLGIKNKKVRGEIGAREDGYI